MAATHDWSRKAILIIVDALRDDAGRLNLGYIEGLIEQGQAARFHVRCVLPSTSRPCYEAIVTGTYPHENGITCNDIVRRSTMRSLFDLVHGAGGSSAVVGYYFFSELYCEAPYDVALHCEREAPGEPVAHGRFYQDGNFPDAHGICQAEYLRARYAPELILLHLNWPDTAGHNAGADSREYATAILTIDAWISRYIRTWLDDRYTIFITGDHGTNARGYHGGADLELRAVPLYIVGSRAFESGRHEVVLEQPVLAAMVCKELDLEPAPTMHRYRAESTPAVQ
ncbi:MAG TPA: alkaline phosphatase family protein [Chloroflexota bacterium]|nr:alkaline phosphatase family protein [Chloroflexota bacterium]